MANIPLKKQLVAFIDLLGFQDFYEIIKRQKTEEGLKMTFRNFDGLYNRYLDMLKECLLGQLASFSGLSFKEKKFKLGKDFQVLAISDCIIIVFDCNEETLPAYFLELSFVLAMLFQRLANRDFIAEHIQDFHYSLFLPIRGGISYDYSNISFNTQTPYIFSSAYNEAVSIEKRACWPRVGISQMLLEKFENKIPFNEIICREFENDEFPFIDQGAVILAMANRLSPETERNNFIERAVKHFREYIILNIRSCAIIYETKPNNRKVKNIYNKWVNFFNNRVSWLLENEMYFATKQELLINDRFVEETFSDVQKWLKAKLEKDAGSKG